MKGGQVMHITRRWIFWAVAALALAAGAVGVSEGRTALPTDLLLSEYVEGTGENQAVEIYNGTGAPVDLAAGGYHISMALPGFRIVPLVGTIAPGEVHVVVDSAASATLRARANQTADLPFDGDDRIYLYKSLPGVPTVTLDVIGQGTGPWGVDPNDTLDSTLRRKSSVTVGDPNDGDPFDPALEWDSYPVDTFDGLGAVVQARGSVTATVTVSAGVCLELSATAVSFGTLSLGVENQPATPDFTVTNCAGAPETLLASGTDATGPGALWPLDDTAQTCTGTPPLALSRYHLFAGRTAGVSLSTANKTIDFLAAGATISQRLGISTACPGSSGSGKSLRMQVNYTATG